MYRAMLLGAILSGLSVSPAAPASSHVEEFHAVFSGFNEVGGLGSGETGAILSDGRATLVFTLRYSGLATSVTQAHIHFGKIHMAGGVMVFFCSNVAAPPGTQPCPA